MKQSNSGYSLFEVLVAFAIMAMVLTVLLPRQTDLLTRIRNIDERTLAHDYAMSRFVQLGVSEPFLIGTNTNDYRGWTVIEEIKTTQLINEDLKELTITITVQDNRGTVLANVKTLVVQNEQP